eukprot:TsM_000034500 transcript=TsM_000034500 gene=TsM_000034500
MSGILWGVVQSSFFVADAALGEPITFLVVTTCPVVIAIHLGVVIFKEIEDPIRQPIYTNLSSLVHKTILTTGDHLQQSEATTAAILKSTPKDDSAVTSTSSSPSTSVQLSSRTLARAARLFEIKLYFRHVAPFSFLSVNPPILHR